MAMDLKIEMIETCSCNMMCPCWYGVRELMVMDQGWHGTVMALRFLEGSTEGVDLGGRTAILGFDFPGPTLFDGEGTARIYIEEGVSPEQIGAIEAVLQARNGGPMAILASLIARWLPTVTAGMEVREDGDDVAIDMVDYGSVRSGLLKNEAGEQVTMHNAAMGLTLGARRVELAPSASHWKDPEMPREFETRSGGRSELHWVA